MNPSLANQGLVQAIYSDGQTAASQNLWVRFGPLGLELFNADGGALEEWDYQQITTIEPLHSGESSQLGHSEMPGARLFIEQGDFSTELIRHLPHISRAAANRRILVPLVAIGGVIAAIGVVIWTTGFSISGAIARQIPDDLRKGLGHQVVASLSAGRSACTKQAGKKALDKMVERLSVGAGQPKKFTVKVVPLRMVNAFAAPGEQIVVSKKLIDFVKSPEELAGVIAHEMGHGIKMHPEAGIVRSLGISAGINIVFGGAPGGLGDVGALLLQMRYSRTAESEADALALAILEKAEIPAKPFASFFAKMEEKLGRRRKASAGKKDSTPRYDGLSRSLDLFSTHPPSPERIAHIERQPDWKSRPVLTSAEWRDLRDICD